MSKHPSIIFAALFLIVGCGEPAAQSKLNATRSKQLVGTWERDITGLPEGTDLKTKYTFEASGQFKRVYSIAADSVEIEVTTKGPWSLTDDKLTLTLMEQGQDAHRLPGSALDDLTDQQWEGVKDGLAPLKPINKGDTQTYTIDKLTPTGLFMGELDENGKQIEIHIYKR